MNNTVEAVLLTVAIFAGCGLVVFVGVWLSLIWFPPFRPGHMSERFNELARYNGERSRGIVHTPEKDAEMAGLQADFNRDLNEEHLR